jgi:hypothetical protein
MYVCMHVCIRTWIRIYIYICWCMYVLWCKKYTLTYTYTEHLPYTCVVRATNKQTHMHMHMHFSGFQNEYLAVPIQWIVLYTYTYIHMCVCIYIYINLSWRTPETLSSRTGSTHYMHTYMHTHTRTRAYMIFSGTPQSSQAASSLHTAGRSETIESYASSDMPMQDSMDPITSRGTSQGYAWICLCVCVCVITYAYGSACVRQ